jgi:hypothetical protein
MGAPTGRKPGRPPDTPKRAKILLRDAAVDAASALIRQAKLGDPAACEVVLRYALREPQEIRDSTGN